MLQVFAGELSAGDKMIHNQARIDMLMLEQSRLAAELAQGDQWDREGYNSPYDWIRFNCKVKGNVAGDYLSVGRQLQALAQSVEAMLKDEIGFAHVATMAGTAAAAVSARVERWAKPIWSVNMASRLWVSAGRCSPTIR